MRLISCHIENFGKIHDKDFNFNKYLNVINEENGWGKSTFAAFIKAMLYGFDTKKEKGSFEKERNIYKPWQGGTYGGELIFEHHDKMYKIVRKFGNTEKNDSFQLFDLGTNLETKDFTKHLGEEIFDLDRNSFARSIFIAQNDCSFDTSDQINAKLGNLVENTNDMNNFETAQSRIKDALNKLSPTRKTGSIKKGKDAITAIQMDLKSLNAAEEGYKKVSALIEKESERRSFLEKNRAKLTAEQKYVSEAGAKIAEQNNFRQLSKIEDEKTSLYNEARQFFPGDIPEVDKIEKITEDVHTLVKLGQNADLCKLGNEERKTYEDLGEKLNNGAADEAMLYEAITENIKRLEDSRKQKEELSEKKIELTNLENLFQANQLKRQEGIPDKDNVGKGKTYATMIFTAIAIALLIIAIINGKDTSTFMFSIIGTAVFLVVAVVLLGISKKEKVSADRHYSRYMQQIRDEDDREMRSLSASRIQIEGLENHIEQARTDIKSFLDSYEFNVDSEEKYQSMLYELRNLKDTYDELHEKEVKYNEASKRYEELNDNIYNRLVVYFEDLQKNPTDYSNKLTILSNKVTECQLAKDAMIKAQNDKDAFMDMHDNKDLFSEYVIEHSLTDLNEKIDKIDEDLNEIRDNIEKYNRQMNDLSEQLDKRDAKLEELHELEDKNEKEQRNFAILEKTTELLQEAKEQFTSRYMTPVANAFRKYYQKITGDTNDNWQLDANISIKMKESGEYRDTAWFSTGYQDLIGVCMRLALVDAMFPLEKSFLILDDPFVNLDDEKLDRANELVSAVSKDYQVIYFTCHSARLPR